MGVFSRRAASPRQPATQAASITEAYVAATRQRAGLLYRIDSVLAGQMVAGRNDGRTRPSRGYGEMALLDCRGTVQYPASEEKPPDWHLFWMLSLSRTKFHWATPTLGSNITALVANGTDVALHYDDAIRMGMRDDGTVWTDDAPYPLMVVQLRTTSADAAEHFVAHTLTKREERYERARTEWEAKRAEREAEEARRNAKSLRTNTSRMDRMPTPTEAADQLLRALEAALDAGISPDTLKRQCSNAIDRLAKVRDDEAK